MSFTSLDALLDSTKIIPFYQDRSNVDPENLFPTSVELHWTSNCNYDCIHCSYGSRRLSKGFLSKKITSCLIDNLIEIGCKAVYLSGGGEPTVMKGWDQYSKKLIQSGVEVALITNGVALNDIFSDTLSSMNYIAASIYSTHESRYKEITGSRFFKEQFGLPKKIKKSNSSVIIGARCVLNKINFDEVYDIYKMAINSGFDYVIFIPAVDYEGRGEELGQKLIESIKENIQNSLDSFDHSRTNVLSLLQKGISYYNRNHYLETIPKKSEGCKVIQMRSSAFVNYNGGVYLCQPDIGNNELEIGNLNDSTFKQIWNSDKHHKVIKKLHNRWNQGLCGNCRSIAFNQKIYQYDENTEVDANMKRDPFL